MEGETNPPMCNKCSGHIAVKHILVECPKFFAIDRKYNHPSIMVMLKETDKVFTRNKSLE